MVSDYALFREMSKVLRSNKIKTKLSRGLINVNGYNLYIINGYVIMSCPDYLKAFKVCFPYEKNTIIQKLNFYIIQTQKTMKISKFQNPIQLINTK